MATGQSLQLHILGTTSDAADASLEGSLDELNQTKTVYPETKLRMVTNCLEMGKNRPENCHDI
ncbi:MAG: hypothetical protein OXE78_03090 [Gammaproteobacteria bacterium]|nr:hypothetical protein [Gammaproteobacteria bacterium]MCY4357379.1 hypothetical protein [Gammaproteobacteria bacterium]